MAMELAYVMQIRANIGQPLEIGSTPGGRRRMIPITGGTFEGERLRGIILPGGADWQIVDANNTVHLEARYVLQTDDGITIEVNNRGVRSAPEEILDRLARGEEVSPEQYYFRTAPFFAVENGKYGWLNDYIYVANCERHATVVIINVFRVM